MIARSPGKIALQTRSFILLSFFSSIFFFLLLNCSSLLVLASINLFNSKVFIIYLVRCYFLFGMKIILLSRGTMYVNVTIPDTYKWWNGDILNHGENHDFSYSTPTSIPVRVSMYITKTDRKKIIVVPFKYVFMFVYRFMVARNEMNIATRKFLTPKNEHRLMCHFWSFIYANDVFLCSYNWPGW